MKTRTILVLLVIILMVVSCIPSLYPLYREKDLIFDNRLLGQFDVDGDLWKFDSLDREWQHNFNEDWDQYRSGKTYKLVVWQDSLEAEFAVHLVRLKGNYYLDFFPVVYHIPHDFLYAHLIPAHIFGKMEFVEDDLILNWFNGDFLKDMMDSNKVKISHKMLEYSILLTANTEELQKFVIKFGDNPRAFVEPEDPDTLYRIP